MWADWFEQWQAATKRSGLDASLQLTQLLVETAAKVNQQSLVALAETVQAQASLALKLQSPQTWREGPEALSQTAIAILQANASLNRTICTEWQHLRQSAGEILEEEELSLGLGVGLPLFNNDRQR